jgi:hypothetical protein
MSTEKWNFAGLVVKDSRAGDAKKAVFVINNTGSNAYSAGSSGAWQKYS